MKESRELLNEAQTAIPAEDQITLDEIQDLLAARMVTAISELAADYDKTINTLSPRSAAVLARAALEAMFRLLGSLHSEELAASIIYGSTKEGKGVRRMFLQFATHPLHQRKAQTRGRKGEQGKVRRN